MFFATSSFIPTAAALGTSLGVGLLVGLERGWRDRELPDGGRVAGLRTFGLIGLLGGVLGMHEHLPLALPAGMLGLALLFAVAYRRAAVATGTLSITTAVAALVTLSLGALAASGAPTVAGAAAVIVMLLLDLKPVLHRWLRLIQPAELNAILQLAVLSAVILPALPDAALGPYGSINPYRLWIAVILIAALSLAGHISSRLVGQRRGLLWVGVLGGLASSTAATLSLARLARGNRDLAHPAAAGVLAACAVMFLRMAGVILVLRPAQTLPLAGVLATLAAASFVASGWIWRAARASQASNATREHQPVQAKVFDLSTALGFGAGLAAVSVLARAASDAFGNAGLYGVAFLSGLADVDAVVISAVQLPAPGMTPAALTIVALLAATANIMVKATMPWAVGGREIGRLVLRGYGLVIATGVALAGAEWLL
jgi:uncharacterized membrane protein (DUF4010 family)